MRSILVACGFSLVTAAGCSGGSGEAGDAGSGTDGGGGGDATSGGDTDARPGVLVTLAVGETPIEGLDVAVNDPDGLVVDELVTPASGTLEFAVPVGGSFTVYYTDAFIDGGFYQRAAIHVVDPPPGSHWSLPLPDPEPLPPPEATVDLTVDPAPAEANSLRVYTACTTAVTISLSVDDLPVTCDGSTTAGQILALAVGPGPVVHGWGTATDVAVTPGGAATPLTIDATSTDFDEVSFGVTGIPTDYRSWTELRLYTDTFQFDLDVNNYSPGPTTNTVSLSPPAGLTARGYAHFGVATDNATGVGERFGMRRWASSLAAIDGTSAVADFALARVTLDPPDLSVPARPALSWTRGVGAAGAVGYVKMVGQNASADDLIHLALFASSPKPFVLPEVPGARLEWRPDTLSVLRVVFEDSGDPAARFAAWAMPPELEDGTYRFAEGIYRVPD